MPRLRSSRKIIAVLLRHHFVRVSQMGSHVKYQNKINSTLTVIVPANKKEIPHGTFRSILRQSGLQEEDFR